MIRIFAAFLTVVMAIAVIGSTASADSKTEQITENFDVLMKEVTCVVITDYAIRHINMFVYQMDQISPSGGERKKVVLPMIAMAIMMRTDVDKRIRVLLDLGLERSYIDGKLSDVTTKIYDQYSKGYLGSTDYDKATIFMEKIFSESAECEKWFRIQFKIDDTQKDKGTGGVNG